MELAKFENDESKSATREGGIASKSGEPLLGDHRPEQRSVGCLIWFQFMEASNGP